MHKNAMVSKAPWIEIMFHRKFENIGGIAMKNYEYKFLEVPRKNGMKVKGGETFEECKQVIMKEAEQEQVCLQKKIC